MKNVLGFTKSLSSIVCNNAAKVKENKAIQLLKNFFLNQNAQSTKFKSEELQFFIIMMKCVTT